MEKIMIQALLQALQAPAWQVATTDQRSVFDQYPDPSQFSAAERHPASFWIDAVSTNSKELPELAAAGHHTLFVPIVGERVDAHRFIQNAREAGSAASLASTAWLNSAAGQEFLASGQVTLLSGLPTSAPETRSHQESLHVPNLNSNLNSNPNSNLEADSCQDSGNPQRIVVSDKAGFLCIEVEDTLAAFQRLAAWYRGLFDIPVIGITGSVGKTTTKEMVAAALESALAIHKTAGNQNSQVGLPLTIFGLERNHQAAVIEMGMSEFGEMSRLAAMARPDHAIMTNIGVAHIGNLGSQENIRSEKLHITDFFHGGSMLFLNADDPLLAECQKLLQNKEWSSQFSPCLSEKSLRLFGIDEKKLESGSQLALESSKTSDFWTSPDLQVKPDLQAKPDFPENSGFYATDIQVSGTGQEFLLHYPGGAPVPIKLQVLGLHNVRNALAALAIAWQLGIPPQTAGKGLASYAPLAMRGNLIEAGGIRILDDSYNASPDSMKSSIEVLASLPDLPDSMTRRFVVFADVLELGERSEALHREVGTFLAAHNRKAKTTNDRKQMEQTKATRQAGQAPIDYLITVGTESLFIEKGYQEAACLEKSVTEDPVPAVICHHFEENTNAAAFLLAELRPGDAILIKGSRGMKTEEIVAALQHR